MKRPESCAGTTEEATNSEEDLARITASMLAILQTSGPDGVNIIDLLERSARMCHMTVNTPEVLKHLGYGPEDMIIRGANFSPAIHEVKA
jgi:hypothetical protein